MALVIENSLPLSLNKKSTNPSIYFHTLLTAGSKTAHETLVAWFPATPVNKHLFRLDGGKCFTSPFWMCSFAHWSKWNYLVGYQTDMRWRSWVVLVSKSVFNSDHILKTRFKVHKWQLGPIKDWWILDIHGTCTVVLSREAFIEKCAFLRLLAQIDSNQPIKTEWWIHMKRSSQLCSLSIFFLLNKK